MDTLCIYIYTYNFSQFLMASFDEENMEFLTSGWNASFFLGRIVRQSQIGMSKSEIPLPRVVWRIDPTEFSRRTRNRNRVSGCFWKMDLLVSFFHFMLKIGTAVLCQFLVLACIYHQQRLLSRRQLFFSWESGSVMWHISLVDWQCTA